MAARLRRVGHKAVSPHARTSLMGPHAFLYVAPDTRLWATTRALLERGLARPPAQVHTDLTSLSNHITISIILH